MIPNSTTHRFSPLGLLGLLGALGLLIATGCAGGKPRQPTALREAYEHALASNNPDAAYDLLSPEAQSRIDRKTYAERWKNNEAERKQALKELRSLDANLKRPIRSGTTTHDGGYVLQWTMIDGEYAVVSGLPGVASTMTPEAAVRALLAALRGVEGTDLDRLLTPELLERLGEDWKGRADKIEKALGTPGRLKYSEPDHDRATLRYDAGRMVVLERTPRGWRIADFR